MTRRAGFTLVEVLVALAIFAMVASAGVGLLSFAIDNRLAVREVSERTAAFQRARALMRADLGQAAPRRVRGADGAPQAAFELGGDSLFAVTRRGWINPSEAPRASMQRVDYRLIDGRLERRVRERLDGARPAEPQVLLENVESAQVTVILDGDPIADWRPVQNRPLPDAVRIDLTLAGYGPVSQLFLVAGADA
ncbi:MAG: type II secretion system minor pseudopilin GspJ [Brevundimonas sp.]|uniref:type II secretion system minor pseudopilin GspJ n=1 Tax=Brevundimonas sp. TaxID=1871086 RepID=UPI0039190CFC